MGRDELRALARVIEAELEKGTDGVVDINSKENAEVHAALLERLAAVSPEAEVTRGDP